MSTSMQGVHEALREHINALPVKKSWLDFRNDRVAANYTGNGRRFELKQRINMGRNDITVHGTGTGDEEGDYTRLSISYAVEPRWLIGFLWLFVGVGVFIFITVGIPGFQGNIQQKDWFLSLIPIMFIAVPVLINFSYQKQIPRLHKEVLAALKYVS